MNLPKLVNAYLIWLVTTATCTSVGRSQNIEVKAAKLEPLEVDEREPFVTAHNTARSAVGVDPLRWSDELAEYARHSLEQQKDALIAEAQEGWGEEKVAMPSHRADTDYGENIAAWAGTKRRPAEFAVALWLSEKAAFKKLDADGSYRVGDEEDKTQADDKGHERPTVVGHYTAIVWRSTKQMGAAKLEFTLTDGCAIRTYVAIICTYCPPGNRRGERPY